VTRATAYRTLPTRREAARFAARSRRAPTRRASPPVRRVASAAALFEDTSFRRAFGNCAVVAIGPTTAADLASFGVHPAAIANKPDVESLVKAIVAALRGKK